MSTFDNRRLTFTVGSLAAIAIFVIVAAWRASAQWTITQDRLDRIEKHLDWNDKRLDAMGSAEPHISPQQPTKL